MSLAGCFFGGGQVTLFADLLVSRGPLEGETPAAQRLPTSPGGLAIPGVQDVRLRRKLYIVNPRLAIGVTGSVSAMKRFVVAAMDRFGSRYASLDEVRAFADERSYPTEGEDALEAIVAHSGVARTGATTFESKITIYAEGDNALEVDTPEFGRVYAIGSGAGAFVSQATGSRALSTSGAGPPYDGLFRALGVAGEFLAQEALFGGGLQDRWGAGFEFLSVINGEFKRPDSVTFTTWKRQGLSFALQSLIKYEKLPNERVLAWAMTKDGPRPFGALGLHEEPGDILEVQLPELTSDIGCHTFLAEVGGRTHSLVLVGPRDPPGVILRKHVTEKETGYAIGLELELQVEMRRRLAALVSARRARGDA